MLGRIIQQSRINMKVGRNNLCPCGSGKKYKGGGIPPCSCKKEWRGDGLVNAQERGLGEESAQASALFFEKIGGYG